VLIGGAAPTDSYLRSDRILDAARQTRAAAIHPGYGFLSENAQFAEECERAGIAFVGPTPAQIRAFALKHTARALAEENGLPLLPGSALLATSRRQPPQPSASAIPSCSRALRAVGASACNAARMSPDCARP